MIKVLHTADIHLDVPFKIANVAKAQTRRSELRGALSSLFTYARLEHFDLMLIAGDMFDREFVTPDTVALVLREMAACSDCRIIIAPGNHDPYTPGMNVVVIVLFCVIPMIAWTATLLAMKNYSLTGEKMKEIQAVNACRRDAVAGGMSLEDAMQKWQTIDQLPAQYRAN